MWLVVSARTQVTQPWNGLWGFGVLGTGWEWRLILLSYGCLPTQMAQALYAWTSASVAAIIRALALSAVGGFINLLAYLQRRVQLHLLSFSREPVWAALALCLPGVFALSVGMFLSVTVEW
jgi:hypothetical protein